MATSLGAEILIRVQGAWDGWRQAEVPLADLHDVHWLQPDGAPHPMLHGFVKCAGTLAATIPHDCSGRGPHPLRVCVLKHHTVPSIYASLAQRAGGVRGGTGMERSAAAGPVTP